VAILQSSGINVGYCKPVGQQHVLLGNAVVDKDALLFGSYMGFRVVPHLHSPVILGSGATSAFLDHPEKYKYNEAIDVARENICDKHEMIIFEGTGHPGVGSVVNLSNAQVAKRLGAGVIIVVEGGIGNTIDRLNLCLSMFKAEDCKILGVIVNKVIPKKMEKVRRYVKIWLDQQQIPLLGVIPYDKTLKFPLMKTICEATKATVLWNEDQLDNKVEDFMAGSLIDRGAFENLQDQLLVVSHKRVDEALNKILIFSKEHGLAESPLSGLLVTGDGNMNDTSLAYVMKHQIPVLRTELDTLGSVLKISQLEVKINLRTPWKVRRAVDLIRSNVDLSPIMKKAQNVNWNE